MSSIPPIILATCRTCCEQDFFNKHGTQNLLAAAASGNVAEVKALTSAYKVHTAHFFTTKAAHDQIDIGSRCASYPKDAPRKSAGKSAMTLQTKFEGALKVHRAKQMRLQREAPQADERAASPAAAAHGPSPSPTRRCRMSLSPLPLPLPDIGMSTGLLGMSNGTWTNVNDRRVENHDALLQQWLAILR